MTEIFPTNRLLRAEEVASVLNVKPATVMDWALRRKIPSLKLNKGRKGIVRFNGRKLNEWLEEKEREAVPKNITAETIEKSKKLRVNRKIMADFDDFVADLKKM